MNKNFFDSERYLITKDSVSDNGLRQLSLESLYVPTVCPDCCWSNIVKKTKCCRHVFDMCEKQPVEICLTRQRYRCKNCGATFVSDDGGYPKKLRMTEEFERFLAQQVVQDVELQYRTLAERYGISVSFVSDAVANYRRSFENDIVTLEPCYRLFFYPFEYERKTRCCICGTNYSEDNVVLGILPEYTAETISKYIETQIQNREDVCVFFCDLVPGVIEAIHSVLPTAGVAIFPGIMKRHIDKIKIDDVPGLYDDKVKAANALLSILKASNLSENEFDNQLNDWWTAMSPRMKEVCGPLWSLLLKYAMACSNGFLYGKDEINIDHILAIIEDLKKRSVAFDNMVVRMLFQNLKMKEQIKKTPHGDYIEFFTGKTKIKRGYHDFSVSFESLFARFGGDTKYGVER